MFGLAPSVAKIHWESLPQVLVLAKEISAFPIACFMWSHLGCEVYVKNSGLHKEIVRIFLAGMLICLFAHFLRHVFCFDGWCDVIAHKEIWRQQGECFHALPSPRRLWSCEKFSVFLCALIWIFATILTLQLHLLFSGLDGKLFFGSHIAVGIWCKSYRELWNILT